MATLLLAFSFYLLLCRGRATLRSHLMFMLLLLLVLIGSALLNNEIVAYFGGNMDWPGAKSSAADRALWSHITTNVDQQWQQAAANYFKKKGINACYWSINPESADTMGWYLTPWDPVSATTSWGQWTGFDPRKTQLLNDLWGM